MLSDFLKLIQETAVKAAAPQVIKVDDSRRIYSVVNGQTTVIDTPPPDRKHLLLSLASFIELARMSTTGSVWHDDEKVTLILDDADRRARATLRLVKSAAFSALEKMASCDAGGRAYTQAQLVRLLRHELRNAGVEHVLAAVRRIDFKRSGGAKGVVEHGKESLGRSVEMEVQGASTIPEFFNATVPVYSTSGADFQETVYCTLEIDVANERFVVLPDADSLASAVQSVQESLHGALDDELDDAMVYYGTP